MSIRWMTRIWQQAEPWQATERLMLLALADSANEEGLCWPSVQTLQKKCAIKTPRGTQKVLQRLEEKGFIKRLERPGQTNHFQLLTPVPQDTPNPCPPGHPVPQDTLSPRTGGGRPPGRGGGVPQDTQPIIEPIKKQQQPRARASETISNGERGLNSAEPVSESVGDVRPSVDANGSADTRPVVAQDYLDEYSSIEGKKERVVGGSVPVGRQPDCPTPRVEAWTLLTEYGIAEKDRLPIIRSRSDGEIRRQIAHLDWKIYHAHRRNKPIQNPAGMLKRMILENWPLPPGAEAKYRERFLAGHEGDGVPEATRPPPEPEPFEDPFQEAWFSLTEQEQSKLIDEALDLLAQTDPHQAQSLLRRNRDWTLAVRLKPQLDPLLENSAQPSP